MVHLLYYQGICLDKISSLALGVKHSSTPSPLSLLLKKANNDFNTIVSLFVNDIKFKRNQVC